MKIYNSTLDRNDKEILEYLLKGYYFHSEVDVNTNYLVCPKEINKERNAIMEIYTTGCFQYGDPDIISTEEAATEYADSELVCVVDLWPKYFFPKYSEDMQLYYDDAIYDRGYNTDSVASLAECLNFAISKGLELAEIKPC